MNADDFNAWLYLMHQRGNSDGDCADMLGRNRTWIWNAKKNGCDHAHALACTALLHGLPVFRAVRAA